jgi:hypothetical protein
VAELIFAGLGSLLLVLLPESGDLIIRAFAYRALFRVAHTLDCPKGAFIVHIQLVGFEKWSVLDIKDNDISKLTLNFSSIGLIFWFSSCNFSIGEHIPNSWPETGALV